MNGVSADMQPTTMIEETSLSALMKSPQLEPRLTLGVIWVATVGGKVRTLYSAKLSE